MNKKCPLCNETLCSDPFISITSVNTWVDCPRKSPIKNSTLSVTEYSINSNEKKEIFRINSYCVVIDHHNNYTEIYELHNHPIHTMFLEDTFIMRISGDDIISTKTTESIKQQLDMILTFS